MSTDDDSPTPPRGNPRMWGDTRRGSTAAERHRREDAARDRRQTEPITDTVLLVDREEMSHAEIEVVRRSKRESSDPATFGDIVKLAVATARRDESGLGQDVDLLSLKRDLKILRTVGGVLLTLVLGSAVWTIERLWSFAELVGITTIRLQHIEENNLRLYQEIRDVRKDKP